MHFHRRGNQYHWRRRIPLGLTCRWGRRELTKSLGTSDYKTAIYRARRFSLTADKLFERIMKTPELSTDTIHELAREWFAEALEADEAQRLSTPPNKAVYTTHYDDLNTKPYEADEEILSILQSDYQEALVDRDFNKVKDVVDGILDQLDIKTEIDAGTYNRLANAILRAHVEVFRVAKAGLCLSTARPDI